MRYPRSTRNCSASRARFHVAAGVEIGMAEIAQRLMVLRHQQSRHALALNHAVLKSFQSAAVQRSVRVRVIAKLESRVEPHVQCGDALVHFVPFVVELALVDERDDRNFLLAQRVGQPLRHRSDFGGGHVARSAGRQVIDRDRNRALRFVVGSAHMRLRLRDDHNRDHHNEQRQQHFH